MSAGAQVDYDALASKHGSAAPQAAAPTVDYDALSKKHSAVDPNAPHIDINTALYIARTGMVPTESEFAKANVEGPKQMAVLDSVIGGVAGGYGLFAPRAATAVAGTGILDASGNEIMKDVTTRLPSIAENAYTGAANAIKAHPFLSGGGLLGYIYHRAIFDMIMKDVLP